MPADLAEATRRAPRSRRGFVSLAAAVGLLLASASYASGPVMAWGEGREPMDMIASAISEGDSYSCAIRAGSGAVVCWGNNSGGQATPPASVNGISGTASAIAAGGYHTLAIRSAAAPVSATGLVGRLAALLALLATGSVAMRRGGRRSV